MHRICNLKCNVPKSIPLIFYNGSNYDYHFIIWVSRKFKKQFTYMEKTLPKIHRTYYNLLIGQDSW